MYFFVNRTIRDKSTETNYYQVQTFFCEWIHFQSHDPLPQCLAKPTLRTTLRGKGDRELCRSTKISNDYPLKHNPYFARVSTTFVSDCTDDSVLSVNICWIDASLLSKTHRKVY